MRTSSRTGYGVNMARKLFGTDGVRGLANTEPITPQTVLRLAVAVGHRFRRGDHRHLVVVGKDTRLSGYMLEPALTAGFVSMGMDVVLVGPLPTPARIPAASVRPRRSATAGSWSCRTCSNPATPWS